MTRHTHARPGTHAPRRGSGTGPDRHPPTEAHELLALQQRAGNAAVGQLLGRAGPLVVQRSTAPPGAWPGTERDYEEPAPVLPDPATVAEALRRHLEGQQETAVDVPPPSPVSSTGTFATARSGPPSVHDPSGPPSAHDPSRPPSIHDPSAPPSVHDPSRPPSLQAPSAHDPSRPPSEHGTGGNEPGPRPSRDSDSDASFVTAPLPRPRLDGDLAKAAGAGVATAVPLLGIANNAGPAPKLVAAGTGTASATAIGDAVSEVVKWLQTGSINLPKFFGGVVTAGGLGFNAAGIATGIDPLRYTGFALQGAGLGVKGAGEGWKWEDGGVDLRAAPSGDIAKMIGSFISAAAPVLQATALAAQRRLEAQAATGSVPPLPAAVAAALLAGGTAGGDFASEIVKGLHDGRVNVPKMMGGLLGMVGAGVMAGGVATNNPIVRYVALGLAELGLASKALGEARKWENDPMGDVSGWPVTGGRRRQAQETGQV